MKGAILALLCVVALVSAELNENGCPINPFVDVLKPHPNCNKFYQCLQGELLERSCAANLVFNVETQECDYAENVDCEYRPVVPDSSEETADSGNGGGNNDPSLAPEICAEDDSDGVLVAHENCNKFYECHNGVPVAHKCASTLLWNPSTGLCDWAENVDCSNRQPGDGDSDNEEGNESSDSDTGKTSGEEGDNGGGNGDGDNGSNGGGGNGDPSEASNICAAYGSDGILVAHENCNQFYKCSEGVPVSFSCPPSLLFNPNNDQCDWPENVKCDGRNPDGGNDGSGDGGNGDGGNGDSGNGGGDNGNNGGGNSNPSDAPEICAAEGSDGVLVAHENCNQFYKCSEGKPVALNCPLNLLYNPSNEQCDWPENVSCDGRNPDGGDSGNGDGAGNGDGGNGDSGNGGSDNGNNVGGGNSNPGDAPEICAAEGSDGVLVAHENCNQFYKCSEGKPVALNCPLNLLYNPSNNQCDWPENVNCDRTPESGNGDGDADSGNGGDGGSDGGNNNPAEALKICAAEESDGVLVAHENCNQFYICSENLPVVRNCPLNLLFNPTNDQCDWPENVDCGRRNSFTSFNKHMLHMRYRI